MPLLTYTLTFQFARAITWTDNQQVPQTMEVCVIPLANPSFPDQGTYVGGLQTQTVLLSNETNSVSFNLVPTNTPGLSEPVNYRAEWRAGGVTGQIYSYDFAMPAQNVTFDELQTLGDIIGGEVYVQQSQIGAAGGVAALNTSGQVVDATGTPVATSADIASVNAAITAETANRTAAVNALNSTLSTSLGEDIAVVQSQTAANLSNAVATLNATLTSNYDALTNNLNTETTARTGADTTFTNQINTINSQITSLTSEVATKADLDSTGHLKMSEVPPTLMLNAYTVSGESGMLNLSSTANNGNLPPVHYADVAVWANGAVFMLVGDPNNPIPSPDPSVLSNWLDLTSVYSVNGLQGNVTLHPQDIGAVGVEGSYGTVTQAQVDGLATTLSEYTPLSSFTTLNQTVTGILNNTNIVYLDTSGPSQGFINHNKLDNNVAYVNSLNEVTLKNGTVIASGTGTIFSVNGYEGPNVTLGAADVGAIPVGGTIPESGVVGLTADLAARVLDTDTRLTNARTPTPHAATHEDGGSDPLTLGQDQVTGLTQALAALAPMSTVSAQAQQINTLSNNVTFLLGGGTPTSSPIKAVWYDGTAQFSGITTLADFQNIYHVAMKSPFGLSQSSGTYYYNPAGANNNEWCYAYITPNGHLELRQWNESNPPDPVYATETDIAGIQQTITTLATRASLSALASQVAACASQTSVNTINTTLGTLATQASVNALTAKLGNCALQSDLDTTNATVATLATQASVNSLSQAINGLASQSALSTLSIQVTNNANTLNTKADLSGPGNTVPLNQLPDLPISQISGLSTQLSELCPLSGGVVPVGNLPQIPASQVVNLTADLAAKADLVNGLVPSSQLPSVSINQVFTAPNQAGMLALTGTAIGDVCVITGSAAQGSYILQALPSTTAANWVLLQNPQAPVVSVNGQTGAVNLTAANVGAMAVGAAIPIAQVSALQSTINGLATTEQLSAAVSGLQSSAQVQGTLTASTEAKQLADYVATAPIPSLAGQQTVDGVLTPLTMSTGPHQGLPPVVLATAQPDSRDNGLWVVQANAWIRTTDFAMGAFFVRGSLVFVNAGAANANTIWQETANSGVVGSSAASSGNPNNWLNIMTAGAPVNYTAGNGITLTGTQFSANPSPTGFLQSTAAGLGVITSGVTRVARAYSGYVPAGSTVATINHNLGTTDIGSVFIQETASGNQVLAGCTVTGQNTITIEFAAAVATATQWRVTVVA